MLSICSFSILYLYVRQWCYKWSSFGSLGLQKPVQSTTPQDEEMSIKSIKARQIFDSRGNPTVEVDLTTAKGNS